ncbi:uncharacterized protein LOC118204798 isoform X2 [Stegodyphus dumicola]|uniref:uncharacterized protein LOC118204798 isoform X2 n=1 Tax=Stegodyphus dumicola TaxID=202533 RepID=UPI0015AF8154|nr:uncharacterized protein LOC118204798 isoform X2 [Stegodyphus dumicola]
MSSQPDEVNTAKPEAMAGNPVLNAMDTSSPHLSTISSSSSAVPESLSSIPVPDPKFVPVPDPDTLIIELKQLYQLKARFTDLEQTLARSKRSTPLANFNLKQVQQESQEEECIEQPSPVISQDVISSLSLPEAPNVSEPSPTPPTSIKSGERKKRKREDSETQDFLSTFQSAGSKKKKKK